jgi:hypothetical protein
MPLFQESKFGSLKTHGEPHGDKTDTFGWPLEIPAVFATLPATHNIDCDLFGLKKIFFKFILF